MLKIKEYTNEYQEQVVDLILDIQVKEFGIPITLEDQPDLLNILDFYQINKGNFWIALDNDTVIGTIALIDIKDKEGAIRKMFVAPTYRGKDKAIAQRLLSSLLAWAKEYEMKSLYLGTNSKFIAAQRFYDKNRFEEIEMNALPPNYPIVKVDTIFYKYSFT